MTKKESGDYGGQFLPHNLFGKNKKTPNSGAYFYSNLPLVILYKSTKFPQRLNQFSGGNPYSRNTFLTAFLYS